MEHRKRPPYSEPCCAESGSITLETDAQISDIIIAGYGQLKFLPAAPGNFTPSHAASIVGKRVKRLPVICLCCYRIMMSGGVIWP